MSGRSVAWLARLFRVQEVVSSNLTAPTIFKITGFRFSIAELGFPGDEPVAEISWRLFCHKPFDRNWNSL